MPTIVSVLTFRNLTDAGEYQDQLIDQGYEPEMRRTKEGTFAVITALEAEGTEEIQEVKEELGNLRSGDREPQVTVLGQSSREEDEQPTGGVDRPRPKRVSLTSKRPETQREKEYRKAYRQNVKFKEAQQRYQQSSGGREAQKRYTKTEHGKAAREAYAKSPKGIAARKAYLERLKERREQAKKLLEERRREQGG